MLRFILNRYVGGFLIFVALSMVLVNFTGEDRPNLTLFEKIIKNVVTPVESGFSQVINRGSGTFNAIFSIGSIRATNKNLTQRVSTLEAENLLLKEYEYQNLRFRELLQFKDTVNNNYDMISASVVARNPSNWFKTITINRGTDDGVKKNMAVVTNFGLVGHVLNVSGASAEVLLIVENSSAVGGLVQVTRTPGVVQGLGDNTGNLKMRYLAKDAPVREKQVVISSGLGGIFPKGVPIGQITKVDTESNGLEKYAILRPFVDFNRVEEVFVIKRVFGENNSPLPNGGD